MQASQASPARTRLWTAFLLTVLMALGPGGAPARAQDPNLDPTVQQQKLEQLRERAAKARTEIGLLDSRQAALAAQLDELGAALDALEAQIGDAQARMAETRATIARLEDSIASSAARQSSYETAIGELSRTLYEASEETGIDRLLSGDLLGFFTQQAYIDRVTGQLRAQILSLKRERGLEQLTLAELEGERDALEETLRLAAAQEGELNKQAAKIERILEQLAAAEEAKRQEYATVQVAIGDTSLTLDQALREQAALAAKEKAAGGGTVATPKPTSAPAQATPHPTPAPTATPTPSPGGDTPSPGSTDPGGAGATPTASPVVTPTPVATPTSTPAPTATPAAGSITFYGRGTDHGVGLSQWGAYGRAVAGQSHQQILAHYYQNTTLGTLSGTPSIRVLVADRIAPTADRPAKVYGWYASWSIQGYAATYPAGGYVTMVPSGSSWNAVVRDSSGTIIATLSGASDITLVPGTSATRFQVWFKPSYYDTYRGSIRLIGSNGTVSAVNKVLLEDYLRGVVPAEMSSSWPGAALRAQAVAARSYAYVHRRSSSYNFDVYDDSRSQVYLGLLGEKTSTSTAVGDTKGVAVMYSGAAANTLFFSTAGGWTENNENVFVSNTGAKLASPVAYLRGVSDRRPDGTSYDSASPKATWKTASYTLAQLSAIFANDSLTNVGSIQRLDLSNRGVSGRLISITLYGTLGSKTVSGSYFKYVFNVYSPVTDPAIWSTLFATSPIP